MIQPSEDGQRLSSTDGGNGSGLRLPDRVGSLLDWMFQSGYSLTKVNHMNVSILDEPPTLESKIFD
jgi:hypothetical protein